MLEEIEAYAPAVNSVLNIFEFSLALLPCFCYRSSEYFVKLLETSEVFEDLGGL